MNYNYSKINNITGWLVFVISSLVYLFTMEPTVSFWDCGEFISVAYNLEIGHPPGAPLFMIIGRVFSMFFSGSDVAPSVNAISALSSGFTILFLFWSITYLLKRVVLKEKKHTLDKAKIIMIMASGLIGSLAFTFSDTFWFSAVEAEVYAFSSMITALVFWAVLKWESMWSEQGSERWIVLIAYVIGLSIGVHLLCLLAIPAITYIIYFKKYEFNFKHLVISTAYGFAALLCVQYVIIQKTFTVASYFELFFVNKMGMPFHSGTIIFTAILFGALAFGIYYTQKHKKKLMNIALVSATLILLGYSSYAVILIRSSANPPLDENNPQNVFTLLDYLSREQYGSAPILFGRVYSTPLDPKEPYTKSKNKYYQDEEAGVYKLLNSGDESAPNFDKKSSVLFPRMYSYEDRHIRGYKEWVDIKGKEVIASNGSKVIVPTLSENITFFFKYQVGWMYFRYFMWNFAGRQNDIQGFGNKINGNWKSGISFIDDMRLGKMNLSEYYTQNKANNAYYFLPLLLGLIGFLFHFKQHRKHWFVLLTLFLFTGLVIHLYTSTTPYQPRERDYAYVGSFYVFAIWIGYGVYALYDYFVNKLNIKQTLRVGIPLCLVSFICVPVIMAKENWDDHDRSNCYTTSDFSKNYLNSCDKNAILFTNGDNDTFPLWYLQEVERYRTDVKIVNLSLLNTDWYSDIVRRDAWEGKGVDYTVPKEKIRGRRNEMIPVVPRKGVKGHIELKDIINFIINDSPDSRISLRQGKQVDYFPTKDFSVKVNLENCLKSETITLDDTNKVLDKITWSISRNYLYKRDLLALDIIASNEWKRPIYFVITAGQDAFLSLQSNYFVQEGFAFKLVPFISKSFDGQVGGINTEKMYDNLMNKFVWGGIDTEESIYLNENNHRMIFNAKNTLNRLASALIIEGKIDKAKNVLEYLNAHLINKNIPVGIVLLSSVELFYKVNNFKDGDNLAKKIIMRYKGDLEYFYTLGIDDRKVIKSSIDRAKYVINQTLVLASSKYKDKSKLIDDLSAEIPVINRLLSLQ